MFGKKNKKVVTEPSKENEKPKRSVEEIRKEYSGLCARAGHIQYQIDAHSKDLSLMNEQLRELNFEAAAAQAETPPPQKQDDNQQGVTPQ